VTEANTVGFIESTELFRVFSPRAARQFQQLQRQVVQTTETQEQTVEATQQIREAAFVVLSPNAELPNEFVLTAGPGIALAVTSGAVTVSATGARVTGGTLDIVVSGQSTVVMPLSGTLATRQNAETLSNKTLAAPKLSGLVNAADDTAAAAAGVPVGGVYHNGGALRFRLT
jgi:hypothetical protein